MKNQSNSTVEKEPNNHAIYYLTSGHFLLRFLLFLVVFGGMWQTARAVVIDTVWMRQTQDVLGVSFHPSSQFFAVGGNGAYVGIWDVNTATELKKYQGMSSGNVSFSKTGKYLLITNELYDFNNGNSLMVFNFEKDSLVFSLKTNYNPYLKVVISKDEESIAVGGANTIEVWNLKTSKRIFRYDTSGIGGLMSIDYSPDGSHIVFSDAGSNRELRLLNIVTNKIDYECKIGQYGFVKYSNDGTKLAYTSPDNGEAIKIMDVNSKQIVSTIPGISQGVSKIVFSNDDSLIIISYSTGKMAIDIWDVYQRKFIKTFYTEPKGYGFVSCDISNSKKYIVGNSGGYLYLFNFDISTNFVEQNLIKETLLFPNPNDNNILCLSLNL